MENQYKKPHIIVPRWQEFARGGSSALLNVMITFPITKLMFRQQLSGFNVIKTINNMYNEGLRFLYRGVAAPLLQKTLSTSLMFGVYDYYIQLFEYEYTKYLKRVNGNMACYKGPLPTVLRLIASGCSGVTEAILTPFERAQTLLQIPKYNTTYHNIFDVFHQLPFREYYRGFSAIAIRNLFGSSLFLALREPVTMKLRASSNRYVVVMTNFISGAVLGAVISTLTFPFNTAKVHLQKVINTEYKSVVTAWIELYRERGSIRSIYKGAGTNFFRGLLSWGIINTLYESFSFILDF